MGEIGLNLSENGERERAGYQPDNVSSTESHT